MLSNSNPLLVFFFIILLFLRRELFPKHEEEKKNTQQSIKRRCNDMLSFLLDWTFTPSFFQPQSDPPNFFLFFVVVFFVVFFCIDGSAGLRFTTVSADLVRLQMDF